MYRSRFEIERKLKQIEYIFKDLKKFEDRIFVNNGLDKETGCYPLEIKLGTFLIYCRSIFQYAYKEISSDNFKKSKYDDYINNDKLIKHFKDLRDSEIHSFAISTLSIVRIESPIVKFDKETRIAEGKKVSLLVETLDDLNSTSERNQEAKIKYHITKRLEDTSELRERLKKEDNANLIDALENGKTICETQEFDDTSDLFILCGRYLESIKSFIKYAYKTKLID